MIKTLTLAAALILFSIPAFSQCGFQVKDVTIRHDQYSASSKSNEEKSQAAQQSQQRQFSRKRYQSLLVDKKTLAQRNTIMRFR